MTVEPGSSIDDQLLKCLQLRALHKSAVLLCRPCVADSGTLHCALHAVLPGPRLLSFANLTCVQLFNLALVAVDSDAHALIIRAGTPLRAAGALAW